MKDALGERMKEYYEMRSRSYLTRRVPVIVRLDGCHFHTFTRGFKKPYDEVFSKVMIETTKYLCENIQGCVLGYTQSDEISLLLLDDFTNTTDGWYDYQIQKIVSVAASLATLQFNKSFNILLNYDTADIEMFYAHSKAAEKGATFDARAFNIPREEVNNYFVWRQTDAERNSVNALAQSLFSHKSLQGLSVKDTIAKCEIEGGVVWGNLLTPQKRGTCLVKKEVTVNGAIRHKWIPDLVIPRFSLDPSYVENLLNSKKEQVD